MSCFESTPTSVGRSIWIRCCSDQNCSRRATVRLGTDTLIANILVFVLYCRPTVYPAIHRLTLENRCWPTNRLLYIESMSVSGVVSKLIFSQSASVYTTLEALRTMHYINS